MNHLILMPTVLCSTYSILTHIDFFHCTERLTCNSRESLITCWSLKKTLGSNYNLKQCWRGQDVLTLWSHHHDWRYTDEHNSVPSTVPVWHPSYPPLTVRSSVNISLGRLQAPPPVLWVDHTPAVIKLRDCHDNCSSIPTEAEKKKKKWVCIVLETGNTERRVSNERETANPTWMTHSQ